MSKIKPMLAETLEDTATLSYPVFASPKLDGIRCLIMGGVAMSRSLKPIPNEFVQAWARDNAPDLEGLDGELLVGEHDEQVFRRTTSAVMSENGEPDFTFHVFDNWDTPEVGFRLRLRALKMSGVGSTIPRTKLVASVTVGGKDELAAFEAKCLERGYEGVMVRAPDGGYKYGRSTLKQGWLLKLKQFKDAEAEVIGFEERMHNDNEAKVDALGHTERSTHAAGMRPAGDLGALVCRTPGGVEFRIGSGFTAAERVSVWASRAALKGQLVKYSYFPQGAKDAPRFPTFIGFRDPKDMS